jgi:6-phosphofructokinase 1
MTRFAVLVSGGDAPGIRACLFGLLAAARHRNVDCLAVPYGLEGLIEGRFEPLPLPNSADVHYGGSPVPSGRSQRFLEPEGQRQAVEQLEGAQVQGLVILGGDGSVRAARVLARMGIPCVVLPVTIDNDVSGTDYSLGFDSGVECVRNTLKGIQETSRACRGRVFCIETLGADVGHLALAGGLAGGADLILLPEFRPQPDEVAEAVQARLHAGAEWVVICTGEGALGTWRSGGQGVAFTYGQEIERVTGIRTRVSIIGYAMRGAEPTAFDVLLGQCMGSRAVELLREGSAGQLVVFRDNRVGSIALGSAGVRRKPLNRQHLELARSRGCLVGSGGEQPFPDPHEPSASS